MKRLLPVVLVLAATTAFAQTAKKDLAQRLLKLQQPELEMLARELAGRPAMQLMQGAANILQTRIAPEKREAMGKSIEADVKSYVDEANPLVRDRVLKLAPSSYGAMLEERFSEEELQQMVTWFDSPVNRKFQQLRPELQSGFIQKLIADTSPVLDPKIRALKQRIGSTLGLPAETTPAGGGAAAKPASK